VRPRVDEARAVRRRLNAPAVPSSGAPARPCSASIFGRHSGPIAELKIGAEFDFCGATKKYAGMPKSFASAAQGNVEGFAERLALFLKVCEAGSFSEAARLLDRAPSSVARQIGSLERQLACGLFKRSTRRLAVTEAGEILRQRGSRILADLEDTRRAISGIDRIPRGKIRVTAPQAFGQRHLVPALAGFLKRYPDVSVELVLEDATVDLIEQRIDLAVRIGALPDSSLIAVPLALQVRVACASPSYLRTRGVPQRLTDLAQHDCLTMPGTPPSGWWVFGTGAKAKRLSVSGRFVCGNIDALLRAGHEGLGVMHMATWLVGEDIRIGKLVRLFPQLPLSKGRTAIHLVRPAGTASAKVRVLIQYLQEYVGAPPYWDEPFL
jgi:DNA-binding transcriptional LysR family regulator